MQSIDVVQRAGNDSNATTKEIHMPFPLLALVPTLLSSLASGASAVLAAGAAGAAGAVAKAAVDSLGDRSELPRLA